MDADYNSIQENSVHSAARPPITFGETIAPAPVLPVVEPEVEDPSAAVVDTEPEPEEPALLPLAEAVEPAVAAAVAAAAVPDTTGVELDEKILIESNSKYAIA